MDTWECIDDKKYIGKKAYLQNWTDDEYMFEDKGIDSSEFSREDIDLPPLTTGEETIAEDEDDDGEEEEPEEDEEERIKVYEIYFPFEVDEDDVNENEYGDDEDDEDLDADEESNRYALNTYNDYSLQVLVVDELIQGIECIGHCHMCGGGMDESLGSFPSAWLEKGAIEVLDALIRLPKIKEPQAVAPHLEAPSIPKPPPDPLEGMIWDPEIPDLPTLRTLSDELMHGDSDKGVVTINMAIAERIDPVVILRCMFHVVEHVFFMFKNGECYLPEIIICLDAFRVMNKPLWSCLEIFGIKPIGDVVIAELRSEDPRWNHVVNILIQIFESVGCSSINLGKNYQTAKIQEIAFGSDKLFALAVANSRSSYAIEKSQEFFNLFEKIGLKEKTTFFLIGDDYGVKHPDWDYVNRFVGNYPEALTTIKYLIGLEKYQLTNLKLRDPKN